MKLIAMCSMYLIRLIAVLVVACFAVLSVGCGGSAGNGPGVYRHSQGAGHVGVARLDWQAPLERIDGDPLKMSELAAYRIRYGRDPELGRSESYDIVLEDGQSMAVEIRALPAGVWYFTIRSIDDAGRAGPWSAIVSKSIPS